MLLVWQNNLTQSISCVTSDELYAFKIAISEEIKRLKVWNELGSTIPTMSASAGAIDATLAELNLTEQEIIDQIKKIRIKLEMTQ